MEFSGDTWGAMARWEPSDYRSRRRKAANRDLLRPGA